MKKRMFSFFAIALTLLTAVASVAKDKVVVHFNGANGGSPLGTLVSDGKGNFFGTSFNGGKKNCTSCPGLVFEISSTGTVSVIHAFSGPDGLGPNGTLIRDGNGNLYGTTANGGASQEGVVFELSPQGNGTWTENVLHSFAGGQDGVVPHGSIALDPQDNLYGTTNSGGTNNEGIVYQLSPQGNGTWTETILHSFGTAGDRGDPFGGVTLDSHGNIFGTTHGGGTNNAGEVYELVPNGKGQWTENIIYSFTGSTDGGVPITPVTLDASGNVYGSTQNNGNAFRYGGTIFKLSPGSGGSWTINVLHAFGGGTDGYEPSAVVFDTAGNIYGTTIYGGTGCYNANFGGCGIVFRLTPRASGPWKETVLHNFESATDGSESQAGVLVDDANQRLYGTTRYGGGRFGYGIVFVVQP